ncbi:MAG: hypothetical protein AB7Q23_08235 [Hyphomonadaceae bacterium]
MAKIIPPADHVVICKELADRGVLTVFSLYQALKYGSQAYIYAKSEVGKIRYRTLSTKMSRTFYVIDDLSVPEHIGLFAFMPPAPAIPRICVTLAPSFADGEDRIAASRGVQALYKKLVTQLKAESVCVLFDAGKVYASRKAAHDIAQQNSTSGNEKLDRALRDALAG